MIFSTDSLGYEIDSVTGSLSVRTKKEKRKLMCLRDGESLIFTVMIDADRSCLMFTSETDVPH